MKDKVFLIFVAIALCSVHYHNVKRAVVTGDHLEYKSNYFLTGSMKDAAQSIKGQMSTNFWAGRGVSCWIATKICAANGLTRYSFDQAGKYFLANRNNETYREYSEQVNKLATCAGGIASLLLFSAFLLVVWRLKNAPLVVIGISIGLQYAWLPMAESQVFPWDAWVPLCWVAILLAYQARRYWLVIVLIPVCSLFKETVIVLSILILFFDEYHKKDKIRLFPYGKKTLRSRLIVFGCVVGSVLVIKMVLSHLGGADNALVNQSFRYPVPCRTGETWIFIRNLHSLTWWRDFNPIWLSGAGLWLGFILAPMRREYRIVAAAYFAITFMVCVMTEARLWQEIVVLFMLGVTHGVERNSPVSVCGTDVNSKSIYLRNCKKGKMK